MNHCHTCTCNEAILIPSFWLEEWTSPEPEWTIEPDHANDVTIHCYPSQAQIEGMKVRAAAVARAMK